MAYPRVLFRYSSVYDDQWRFYAVQSGANTYPRTEKVRSFLDRLEQEWRVHEDVVFSSIAKNSGIPWETIEHTCYVVGSAAPFSDPLTLPVFSDEAPIDYAADVLTHELIHRNLLESSFVGKWDGVMNRLRGDFPDASENTLVHVIVHAIHWRVFLEVFSANRLERERRVMAKNADYQRSWDIVESVGAERVIRMYLHNERT